MKAEKVKKTEGHWSSADVVDLEYFLMHASSSEKRGESAQQSRNWFQQHVSDHSVEGHAEFPDPKVLKAWLDQTVSQHKRFDFFSADICEHTTIYLDAWTEHLAAFFDHFLSLNRIIDDVPIFKRQIVFTHDGTHALTPSTRWFQVGDDFERLI